MTIEGWIFCCAVFVAAANSCNGFCQFPPSLWCSSPEIAEECGVSTQCHGWTCLAQVDAKPVDLVVYYESMCEQCNDLFQDQLDHAYKEVAEIMNLQLVPYGNTKETPDGDNWIFTCEHGAKQCRGNIIQACAIHFAQNISVSFPFIKCMMTVNPDPDIAVEWNQSFDQIFVWIRAPANSKENQPCARELGLGDLWVDAFTCAEGSEGQKQKHQMALRTKALQKPDYCDFPWVTLNGDFIGDILEKEGTDLVSLICQEYQGPLPYACRMEKTNPHHSCLKA